MKLNYIPDSLNGTMDALQSAASRLEYVRGRLSSESCDAEQFAMSNLGCSLGASAVAVTDEVTAENSVLSFRSQSLAHDLQKSKNVFAQAEDKLIASVLGIGAMLFKSLNNSEIQQMNERMELEQEAMLQANARIKQDLEEFISKVATVIAVGSAARGRLQNDLVAARDVVGVAAHNLIQATKIPKSFSSFNIENLEQINPDICRKGVKCGWSADDVWDPKFKQQCTYYAALRRTQLGRQLPPGAWGNGGQWANSARNAGSQVSSMPEQGDVFCAPPGASGGSVGHVGVVEKINDDGSILISEANWGSPGQFGTRTLTPAQYSSWQFIK
ncbi:MAG: CHAP domain-containing protein [Candidatus Ancillula sp.]|jgi:surface antigen|nr:CHAP domain-containing protein [Candidatus Ancillula sp.]